MNNVMLVGRLAQDVELKKLDDNKEVANIAIAVNRNFKNMDGIYDVDFIDCILWDGLAHNISEYCKKGDTIGVRGRIQVTNYEKDGIKHKSVDVVVERITFLSSRSESKNSSEKKLEDINNDFNEKNNKKEKNK